MAKRFGRNQKRALKAQVDAQIKRVEDMRRWIIHTEGLMKHVKDRTDSVVNDVEYMRSVLPAYSVLMPALTVHLGQPSHSGNVRIAMSQEHPAILNIYDAKDFTSMMMQVINVPEVVTELRKLGGRVHVDVRYGDNTARYAIDRASAAKQPRRLFVDHVARTIAQHLHEELRRESL